MSAELPDDEGAIAFGEKLLALLDEGRFTATYKYAVLLGLIDCCLEHTSGSGSPPDSVSTSALAEKVLQRYWPQTTPWAATTSATLLNQTTTRGQAEIVTLIARFRGRAAPDPSATLFQARAAAPESYARLVANIEWKLIEMPLPRLQLIGASQMPFIYTIDWDESIRRSAVTSPREVRFIPGAAEYLVRLAGLIRPLVQRQWAAMVARMNPELLSDSRLEEFLFGASRIPLDRIRSPLRELQDNRCFYCECALREAAVDHFIPWARHPDNGLDNLVLADRACNSAKRDFLAAPRHVERWSERLRHDSPVSAELAAVAEKVQWERDPAKTLSVARAVYLRLPRGYKLWLRQREFVTIDETVVRDLLTA